MSSATSTCTTSVATNELPASNPAKKAARSSAPVAATPSPSSLPSSAKSRTMSVSTTAILATTSVQTKNLRLLIAPRSIMSIGKSSTQTNTEIGSNNAVRNYQHLFRSSQIQRLVQQVF